VGATAYCNEAGNYCVDPETMQKFYRHTIDVEGTCNNYYQVVIRGGDQTRTRRIKVSRSYSTDPDGHVCYDNDANPGSHVNALLLDLDVNQGGWGGQSYVWKIRSLQTTYHNGFADAGHTGHGNDFYVMLLGGYNNGEDPMRYYVDLYDFDSTVEVKYSSAETVSYDVAARDPITEINWANLYAHWDLTGRGIYSTGSNVGIGTTAPGYKLDVSGDIRATGHWYWSPSKNFYLNATANNQEWSFDLKNTGTYSGTYWQVWSDTQSSILAVRGDTGNVGIGTTSPRYKLDVSGTGRFTNPVIVGTPTGDTHAATKSYVDSAAGGGVGSGTSGQTLRHDGTSWVANSLLYNNGTNIGIGTTSPGATLDVHGSFELGVGAGTGGTVYAIGFTRTAGAMLYDNAGSALTLGGDSTGKDVTILSNGNVGIGTTSPGYKLDVSGTGYVDSVGRKYYRHTIDVAGTCNNYYQVVVLGGDQTRERRIRVSRSYSTDPDGHVCYDNDANPGSHVNALLLEIDVNQGGWGGQSYRWEIQTLQTMYHSGFADAGHTGHGSDFYVMLLGGYNNGEDPMRYYVDLYDYDSSVEVKYSSAETVSYDVAALDPIMLH